jgi:hypothetical protein
MRSMSLRPPLGSGFGDYTPYHLFRSNAGTAIISVSLSHDCCQTYNATGIPVRSIEMRRIVARIFSIARNAARSFPKLRKKGNQPEQTISTLIY